MRCMNCGWENPENVNKCEKCNTLLGTANVEQPKPLQEQQPREILKGTVAEVQVFAEPASEFNDVHVCRKCGFPLREGMKHCPNCGESLAERVEHKPQPHSAHNATVNPWANPVANKTFKLCPVAWDNEAPNKTELSFEGNSVELNRANTDAANNTITSKVQAEIVYEDGKWFIVDKSTQNTTFVYAGRKIELENGDTIMLGNRKFTFVTE